MSSRASLGANRQTFSVEHDVVVALDKISDDPFEYQLSDVVRQVVRLLVRGEHGFGDNLYMFTGVYAS